MSALVWPATITKTFEGSGTAVRLSNGELEFFVVARNDAQLRQALAFIDDQVPWDDRKMFRVDVHSKEQS